MSSLVQALNDYRSWRTRTFMWTRELSVAQRVMLAFVMAAVTGLVAQVRVPLPFTPVPVTGQVFAALLAGALLGGGFGALSQGIYLALGAAGVPWFAGLTGGSAIVAGVTGGYLVGFIAAAALIGRVTDRVPAARRFWPLFGVMLAGVAVIYACGAAWLSVITSGDWARVFAWGLAPFIGVDVAKAVLAAGIACDRTAPGKAA